MHITKVRGVLAVTLYGDEVSRFAELLKPWRNKPWATTWLNMLEPMIAPVIEAPHVCRFVYQYNGGQEQRKCACGAVETIAVNKTPRLLHVFREHEIDSTTNACTLCGLGYSVGSVWPYSAGRCPKAEDEDETTQSEAMQAEAYRLLGTGIEDDPEEDGRLVQINLDAKDSICKNCSKPLYRHTDSGHCISWGAATNSIFQPTQKLLVAAPVDSAREPVGEMREMVENIQAAVDKCPHGAPRGSYCYSCTNTEVPAEALEDAVFAEIIPDEPENGVRCG